VSRFGGRLLIPKILKPNSESSDLVVSLNKCHLSDNSFNAIVPLLSVIPELYIAGSSS